jgi:thiol-disulfide isomerase/thioredoxin
MFSEIQSIEQFARLKEEQAVLAYFSTEVCSVCHVLKPKVEELILQKFPNIKLISIKSDEFPEIAAQNQVFTAPTILVFFEGREYIRKSRNIGVLELQEALERPYSLVFG